MNFISNRFSFQLTIQTTAPLGTPNNRHGGQLAGRRALPDGASRQQPSLPPLPAGSEDSTGLRLQPPTAAPARRGPALSEAGRALPGAARSRPGDCPASRPPRLSRGERAAPGSCGAGAALRGAPRFPLGVAATARRHPAPPPCSGGSCSG